MHKAFDGNLQEVHMLAALPVVPACGHVWQLLVSALICLRLLYLPCKRNGSGHSITRILIAVSLMWYLAAAAAATMHWTTWLT